METWQSEVVGRANHKDQMYIVGVGKIPQKSGGGWH